MDDCNTIPGRTAKRKAHSSCEESGRDGCVGWKEGGRVARMGRVLGTCLLTMRLSSLPQLLLGREERKACNRKREWERILCSLPLYCMPLSLPQSLPVALSHTHIHIHIHIHIHTHTTPAYTTPTQPYFALFFITLLFLWALLPRSLAPSFPRFLFCSSY